MISEDIFDLTIHDDETGEILLHACMTQQEVEHALSVFDLVHDRPRMTLVRAVLAAGLYSFNGESVFVRRVPTPI